MPLIDDFESRFVLGVPAMDRSHREMVEMLNRMDGAADADFVYLFHDLLSHTRAHFASEEVLMAQTRFPATSEHKSEHARVLGELTRFAGHLVGPRLNLARAYVRGQIPSWFAQHALTMDSALAAHLTGRTAVAAPRPSPPAKAEPSPPVSR